MLTSCTRGVGRQVETELGHTLFRQISTTVVPHKIINSPATRNVSTHTEDSHMRNTKIGGKGGLGMRGWELHSYGGPSDLQLTSGLKVPLLKNPKDVLVKVMASSVNPIDVAMSRGYGAEGINAMRSLNDVDCCDTSKLHTLRNTYIEFPLTLGRDFAGIVTEMGHGVRGLQLGDEVYGVLGVQRSGSHAQFVVASSDTVISIFKTRIL